MPDEIGPDLNRDGIIDLSPPGNPGVPGSYIRSSWVVNLDASATSPPPISFTWDISTTSGVNVVHQVSGAKTAVSVPQLGTYNVALTAHYADRDLHSSGTITPTNYLIVSMGDSIASGEGNPDIPELWNSTPQATTDFFEAVDILFAVSIGGVAGVVGSGYAVNQLNIDFSNIQPASPPRWENQSCHRSASSGPALAALALERSDPHSSVTFISEACSGANILQHEGVYPGNGGVLDPYVGHEPLPSGAWAAQLAAVATVLCPMGANVPTDPGPNWVNPVKAQCRPIDALLLTAGANDFGFGTAALACSLPDFDCSGPDPLAVGMQQAISNGLANLPAELSTLNSSVRSGLNVNRIYFAEYPDPTHGDSGGLCSSMVLPNVIKDAVAASPKFNELEKIGVDVLLSTLNASDGQVNANEVTWLNNHVFRPLQNIVAAASRSNGWTPIELADEFITHGYCATTPWVERYQDSKALENTRDGTFHPNFLGHEAYARHMVDMLRQDFSGSLHGPTWNAQEASRLSAASWGPNRVDVFALGGDWSVQHKWQENGGWGPSLTNLEGLGSLFKGPPSAVSWGLHRLDVFEQATDGEYYHKGVDAALGWMPPQPGIWESIGGYFIGRPSAISWGPGRLDVFGRGGDGGLYHKWYTSTGGWGPSQTGWEQAGGVFMSDPVAVSWGVNRLDVVGQALDGEYVHMWSTGNNDWHAGADLGMPATGATIQPPTVVSWGVNRLDVFVVGGDFQLYHKWSADGGVTWGPSQSSWEPLGGIIVGQASAVAWGSNRIDIVAEGGNGAYYHKWWDGAAWGPSQTDWEPHGGSFASPPVISSWGSNELDIFGRWSDGTLKHQALTNNGLSWSPSVTTWQDLGGSLH
jgi:hypothetical protein